MALKKRIQSILVIVLIGAVTASIAYASANNNRKCKSGSCGAATAWCAAVWPATPCARCNGTAKKTTCFYAMASNCEMTDGSQPCGERVEGSCISHNCGGAMVTTSCGVTNCKP